MLLYAGCRLATASKHIGGLERIASHDGAARLALHQADVLLRTVPKPHAVPAKPPDDAFKVRAYSADRSCSCATFLGPTYGGGPIAELQPFRSATSGGTWLAFSTGRRVVGLMAWPMDGDPAHSMGLIAHPGDVSCLAVSFDGRKLLTAGGWGACGVLS